MSQAIAEVMPDANFPELADVVVIDGGIIGVATALYLIKRGLRVASKPNDGARGLARAKRPAASFNRWRSRR